MAVLDPWPTLRDNILRYAEFGAKAQFIAMADACDVCRALDGRLLEPSQAPRIPVEGCTNEFCRCDYSPKL